MCCDPRAAPGPGSLSAALPPFFDGTQTADLSLDLLPTETHSGTSRLASLSPKPLRCHISAVKPPDENSWVTTWPLVRSASSRGEGPSTSASHCVASAWHGAWHLMSTTSAFQARHTDPSKPPLGPEFTF